MARSYATVGQMMSYAIDRSVVSPDVQMPRDRNRDVELLLRHMLEFVLMAARRRDAFLRTVAQTDHTTGSITSAPRMSSTAPALIAERRPSSSDTDESARQGTSLRVGHAPRPTGPDRRAPAQLQRYRRLGAPGDLPARRRTVLRPTAEQAAPSAGHLTPAPPGGDHPPVRPGRFRGSRRAGPPGAAGPTGRSG